MNRKLTVAVHAALAAALLAGCASDGGAPGKTGSAKAIEIKPLQRITGEAGPDAWYQLGRYYQGQGRWQQAEAAFRRTVGIDGSHAEAHNALGAVLAALGQLAAAESEFRTASLAAPGAAHIRGNLGRVLMLQGKVDEAVAMLEDAARLDPANRSVRSNLAEARAKGGRDVAPAPTPASALADANSSQPALQPPIAANQQAAAVQQLPATAQQVPQVVQQAAVVGLQPSAAAMQPAVAIQQLPEPAQPAAMAVQPALVPQVAALPVPAPMAAPAAVTVVAVVPATAESPAREATAKEAPAKELPAKESQATDRIVVLPSVAIGDSRAVVKLIEPVAPAAVEARSESASATLAVTVVQAATAEPLALPVAADEPAASATELAAAVEPPVGSSVPSSETMVEGSVVEADITVAALSAEPALAAVPVAEAVTTAALPPLPQLLLTKAVEAGQRVRLEVSNGNGITGMARRVRVALSTQGYAPPIRITNSQPYRQRVTAIQYRVGFEPQARALGGKLPGNAGVVYQARLDARADVRIVLGRDLPRNFAFNEGEPESVQTVRLAAAGPVEK